MQNAPHPRTVLHHLSIAGIIGAGKSVLARRLGQELGLQVHYESIPDTKLLQDFYADQSKYAFQLQMHLLETRTMQHRRVSITHGVEDRCAYEDAVFADMLYLQGKMTATEHSICKSLQNMVHQTLDPPTVLIYLEVEPSTALARIAERNRHFEKGITLEYLTDLKQHYSRWLEMIPVQMPGVRIIKVCWEEFPDDQGLTLLTEKLAEMITTPRVPETLVL